MSSIHCVTAQILPRQRLAEPGIEVALLGGQDGGVPPDDRRPTDDAALDFALRVGELLLSNGAGAADVSATMAALTNHWGLHSAQVSVTFTTLTISYQYQPGQPLITASRQVRHRETDFDDLTRADHLVRDVLSNVLDLPAAQARLVEIVKRGHRTPRWAVTIAWGVKGAAIAILLGGTPAGAAVAGATAAALEVALRLIARLRLPEFYGQVLGGLIASLVAVACEAFDAPVNGSFVVISGIVMLLAGLGLIGAFQDALTGFPVTANGRILEVLLSTVGIIAGVSAGLTIGRQLDVQTLRPITFADFAEPTVAGLAGAVSAAGFAFAAYAPARSLLPIAGVSGAATAVFSAIAAEGLSPAWPAAVSALLIGLVGYGVARSIHVPPLVVVVAAIVPLLPGLSIYRGLTQLADSSVIGILSLIDALASGIALAAGVILGEYIAQPIGRGGRRLERRLSGPRLVGPLRSQWPRARRKFGRTGG